VLLELLRRAAVDRHLRLELTDPLLGRGQLRQFGRRRPWLGKRPAEWWMLVSRVPLMGRATV
jgi:hypothetical protein